MRRTRTRAFLTAICLAVLVSVSCASPSQELDFAPIDLTPAQTDTIATNITEFPVGTQLAIAMVEGEVVTFTGLVAMPERWREVENRDSVFEIGSISKVFTSVLLSTLVSNGTVELNEPISADLPYDMKEPEREGVNITYQHLANHTSGFPRLPTNLTSILTPNNPFVNYSDEKLQQYLVEEMKLLTTPGEAFLYSNLAVGLLGRLLELKTGESYSQLLDNYVTEKYSLANTTVDRARISDKLVTGQDRKGEPTSNWDLNVLKGAGAILSTTSDLAKFVQANFEVDHILELPRQRTFQLNETVSVGLGWLIINRIDGTVAYFHDGGTGGYRSSMFVNVADKKAVIVLSNVSGYHSDATDIDAIASGLLKTL